MSYLLGGPGLSLQNPFVVPAHMMSLYSYREVMISPPRSGSCKHFTSALRTVHSLPRGDACVPTHSVPSRSSMRTLTRWFANSGWMVRVPFFQLPSPLRVPIHSV